jgi:hypothetical protein
MVPRPGVLRTSMVPPMDWTMEWQMASPSPVPTPTGLVVKKGSKMRCITSGLMPAPLSSTSTTTRRALLSLQVAMRRRLFVSPLGGRPGSR